MATKQTGWSRWYDDAPTHPKFLAVGHKGGWLYLCGQAYASKHATDGLIPKAIVPRLSDVPAPMKVAKKLVEVGLWHDRGDHFEQHDFTEMQTTAAEREEKREQARERQRRSRERRRHQDGDPGRDTEPPVTRDTDVTSRVTHAPVTVAEAEAEADVGQEEGAHDPDSLTLLASMIPSRHRPDLDAFPGRERLADALDAAVTAGWPPGRAVQAVLAGSFDTARSVGAVLVRRAETLARQKPPATGPDVPCPDCNGAGIRWSDDGTTAWPCGHPNARSTA